MITRVRLASVVFAWLLVSATVSFAQQPDSLTSPLATMRPNSGAIGGQVGASYLAAGGDYHDGARPRFSFAGSFRYVATHWGWQLNPYYTWAGYGVSTPTPIVDPAAPNEPYKDHYLTQIAGASAQILRMHTRGSWTWHLGAGPALYRVWLENDRHVIKDPTTFRRHQGTYVGASAELGVEHFLKNLTTTSLEWTVGWHMAFAKRDDQFPNGFSDSPQVFEVRFGGHYYYDLSLGKKSGAKPAPAR